MVTNRAPWGSQASIVPVHVPGTVSSLSSTSAAWYCFRLPHGDRHSPPDEASSHRAATVIVVATPAVSPILLHSAAGLLRATHEFGHGCLVTSPESASKATALTNRTATMTNTTSHRFHKDSLSTTVPEPSRCGNETRNGKRQILLQIIRENNRCVRKNGASQFTWGRQSRA